jgi:hypothetical protein
MRTTLEIEDEVLETTKAIAETRGISLGKAISALLKEALSRPPGISRPDGFPVMPTLPPGGAEPLTSERVAELMAAEDDDLKRFLR